MIGVISTPQFVFAQESQDSIDNGVYKIHVLTLNLWDIGKVEGEYSTQRVNAACQLFKEAYKNGGWDIILIQELWPLKERKDALKDCGYPYVLNVDGKYDEVEGFFLFLAEQLYDDRIDTGLRILSRFRVSDVKRHTYSENGSFGRLLEAMVGLSQDAEYIASKSAMLATVHHPEVGPILVANTHLVSNFQDENYSEQRWLQLKELSQFVNENIRDYHVGGIVGGDFNIGPLEEGNEHNERYRNEVYSWDTIMAQLFSDFYHATPLGECTYCFTSNQFATAEGGVDERIDHILASKNLILDSFGLVDKKVTLEDGVRVPLSDHYGVEAVLKIKK